MNKTLLKKSFKLLNWKLLSVIFLTLFIPIIYRTIRFFYLGTLPNSYSFSIAGNLQWINVLFEVLEEAFLLPLFFSLNRIINNKDANKKISGTISSISLIYLFFIIIFVLFTKNMMGFMSVYKINPITIKFVRIEFFTRFFIMLTKISLVILIAKSKWKQILIILCIQTAINISLDNFIVSNTWYSLNLGVVWIGWDQLISNIIASVIYIFIIFNVYEFKKKDLIPKFFIDKKSIKQNIWSGLESFVRNAFFIWFVIKTINTLNKGQSQGDFWVATSFIWDWLLLPILALGQYLNRKQAFEKEISLKEKLIAPFILISFVILIWMALIPAYNPFVKYVLNNNHSKVISHLVIISLGFYILMAFNDPIDKILYGDGKSQYMLIQSLLTNIIVYLPYYYLTTHMTIDQVAIMMGTAIAVDSIITFIMFIVWAYIKKNKENKNKQNKIIKI